jgi:hypothetical protein
MSRSRQKSKQKKPSWRDYDDRLWRGYPEMPRPLSLNPGIEVVEAAAEGNAMARAIAAAWTLVVPVRTVEVLP